MTVPTATEPRTEAGRLMESWLREADDYEWGRKITAAICAIESEAVKDAAALLERWLYVGSLTRADVDALTQSTEEWIHEQANFEASPGQQRLHATMCFDVECPECARSAEAGNR